MFPVTSPLTIPAFVLVMIRNKRSRNATGTWVNVLLEIGRNLSNNSSRKIGTHAIRPLGESTGSASRLFLGARTKSPTIGIRVPILVRHRLQKFPLATRKAPHDKHNLFPKLQRDLKFNTQKHYCARLCTLARRACPQARTSATSTTGRWTTSGA